MADDGAAGGWRRGAGVALALALFVVGIWVLRGFVVPLLWAGVLAVALWPLHERTRARLGWREDGAALPLVFTLAAAMVFLLPFGFLATQAGREAGTLLRWLSEARATGLPEPGWIGALPFGRDEASGLWNDYLGSPEAVEALLARLREGGLLGLGRQLGADVLHRSVQLLFALLAFFFLLKDGRVLSAQGHEAARRAFGPRGEALLQQMVASVHGTVNGLVLVGLGTGAVLGIAYVVAGVPHPALMAGLTALAACIPFGAPLVFGAASLLLVAQGAVGAGAGVFAFGMAVLFVSDHFIRPALIGGATRLPFLLVLLGILGGVEAFGLIGLFLGPAVMACLVLLWRDFVSDHRTVGS